MRISLIEVDIESDDVFFAPLVAREPVNVFSPIFDVFTPGDG